MLLSVVGVGAGCLLLSAGAAFAYWETTDSSNPAVAAAGSLSAPTAGAATGTATSDAVPISWGVPTGYTPTGYTVLRCAGSSCTPTTPVASGGCSGLISATTCTDTDPALAAGTIYTYAVTASLDNWVSPAGTPFTAATTGASQLAFTVQPAANAKIQAGTGTFPVSVAIEDSNGATLANDNNDTVTLALNKSNGATLSCTGGLTATVSSGVASFTGCTIDKAARNYQLVVTSSVTPALASPTGNSFDVTAGAATQLVFTSSPLTGPASSAANLGPVTVQEEDAAGQRRERGLRRRHRQPVGQPLVGRGVLGLVRWLIGHQRDHPVRAVHGQLLRRRQQQRITGGDRVGHRPDLGHPDRDHPGRTAEDHLEPGLGSGLIHRHDRADQGLSLS